MHDFVNRRNTHMSMIERIYQRVMKHLYQDRMVVVVYDQNMHHISGMDLKRPFLYIKSAQHQILWGLFVLVLFLIDSNDLSILLKCWLFFAVCMANLIYFDFVSVPTRYIHPTLSKPMLQRKTSTVPINKVRESATISAERAELASKDHISLKQCEFHILQVKILDGKDGMDDEELKSNNGLPVGQQQQQLLLPLSNGHASRSNYSTTGTSPVATTANIHHKLGSNASHATTGAPINTNSNHFSAIQAIVRTAASARIYFQIIITGGRNRWDVWRSYEEFFAVYQILSNTYVNHKLPKLPSLGRMKKTWRNRGSFSRSSSASSKGGGMDPKTRTPSKGSEAILGTTGATTGATGTTTTGGQVESVAATGDDDDNETIYFDVSFLQKLQAEISGWLRIMQMDPLGDEFILRALLNLPAYHGSLTGRLSQPALLMQSTATATPISTPAKPLTSSNTTAPTAAAAAAAGGGGGGGATVATNAAMSTHAPGGGSSVGSSGVLSQSDNSANESGFISKTSAKERGLKEVSQPVSGDCSPVTSTPSADTADDTVTPATNHASADNDGLTKQAANADKASIAAKDPNTAPVVASPNQTNSASLPIFKKPNDYVSPCGCWKGNSFDTFEWLDLSPKARDMFIDIQYTHDFRVRGPNYLKDKKKVEAGGSLAKLALMETFHVNKAKYGDRLDHIAAIGRVRRRIEVMHSLPEKPFVLLLNLQIPGDPPVSIVFYFMIPPNFYSCQNNCQDADDDTSAAKSSGTGSTTGSGGTSTSASGDDGSRKSEPLTETERKAADMFRRFIDIPFAPVKQESEEYLNQEMEAAFGGSSASSSTTAATATGLGSGASVGAGIKRSVSSATVHQSGAGAGGSSTVKGRNELPEMEEGEERPTLSRGYTTATALHDRSPKTTTSTSTLATSRDDALDASATTTSANTGTATASAIAGVESDKNGLLKSVHYVQPAPKSWTADVVWPDLSNPAHSPEGVLPLTSFQNKRFKLIPTMVEAPWVVQMAVSSTPVLLGQKVVQRYWRGKGYCEIDVHVGSSAIADNIVGLCRNYSKAFICNLGIVLQGESADELPEQMLACGAIKYMSVDIVSDLESYPF